MVNSRIMLWTDGRGSFQWGWPRMSLGCHTRPVSSVCTILLGSFPVFSGASSGAGVVCSEEGLLGNHLEWLVISYYSKGASIQVRVEAIDAEHNGEHLPVNVWVVALC